MRIDPAAMGNGSARGVCFLEFDEILLMTMRSYTLSCLRPLAKLLLRWPEGIKFSV